jgi:hypothetical protein
MKTIELYTVEWRDGYERHTEHDVSLDTMRSWFEDGGGGNADEYADEFKIISDLAVVTIKALISRTAWAR